jgi:hypothetical protein
VSKRIALGGLALFIILAAICGKTAVDLRAERRELRRTITANDFLKKTLGEMIVAIDAKQREIDRLTRTNCGGREQVPPRSPVAPNRGKVSGSGAVRHRSGEGIASGESEIK